MWLKLVFAIIVLSLPFMLFLFGAFKPLRGLVQLYYTLMLLVSVIPLALYFAYDYTLDTYSGDFSIVIDMILYAYVVLLVFIEILYILLKPRNWVGWGIVFSSRKDYKAWLLKAFWYSVGSVIMVALGIYLLINNYQYESSIYLQYSMYIVFAILIWHYLMAIF